MSFYRFACKALAILAFSPLWSLAATSDVPVQVEIGSLRNTKGDVICLLFNSPEGFPETHAKAYKEVHASIDAGRAVCDFKDVTPGTYALIAFHDENHNGKMDKNFMGIPQEGYLASNNVRPMMSAPEFKDASFTVPAAPASTIKLLMRY